MLSYFYYYAFEFDWRRQVVSIISKDVVLKEEKSKEFGWKRHARISIEDPFEIGYDVGHVLREDTARRLRCEFERAYMILSGGCKVTGVDALNLLLEEYVDEKAIAATVTKKDEKERKQNAQDEIKATYGEMKD